MRAVRLLLLDTAAIAGPLPFLTVIIVCTARDIAFQGWYAVVAMGMLFIFPVTRAYVIVVDRAIDVRVVVRQGVQYLLASGSIRVLQVVISIGIIRHRRINSLLLRKHGDDDDDSSREGPQLRLIPEYGTYYMRYKKRLMVIEHRKDSQPNMTRMRPTHYMRLQIWLAWDRNIILDIVREAKTAYEETQPIMVEYFQTDQYGDWNEQAIPPRALKSVYHPEGLIRDLIGDVQTYLGSKKIYTDLGIPYRRGYLLTGPPGTGKSTLILAVASHFKLPIYSVPLRGPN